MSEPIKIEIIGKNNEKISNATLKILNSDKVDESIKEYIGYKKIDIIQEFLQKMDKKRIVNTAIGASKKSEEKELWTPYYKGESYFGSVVGVIEDELQVHVDEEFIDLQNINSSVQIQSLTIKIRLQIKSRFDTVKPYFLATLLLRNNIKLDDNMVLSSEEDIYDYMLLFWYKSRLQEAFMKGFFKTYRRFEANNERIKGAIDVARHIKLNVGQNNGKIAYSYRENTINNYLNHLIIAAYDYLKKRHPELMEANFDNIPDMKEIIDGIRCEIGYNSMESRTLISKNNKPISHPYFVEYEDLRIICIKILRDEGISIWDAENEKTKSILFYVPDLWELYLEDKLRVKLGNELFAQGRMPGKPENKAVKIFGDLDAKENEDFTKSIYPDYIFFDNENPYMVLDAKFKKGWGKSILEGNNSTISELEDYDKCIRDMNSLNVHATGIIYPTNILSTNNSEYIDERYISHKISQYNDLDVFYTFPIFVPEVCESYTDWKKDFDKQVGNAIDCIVEKIEIEKKRAKEIKEYMDAFSKRES